MSTGVKHIRGNPTKGRVVHFDTCYARGKGTQALCGSTRAVSATPVRNAVTCKKCLRALHKIDKLPLVNKDYNDAVIEINDIQRQQLKFVAHKIVDISAMPYCWEDIYYRLTTGHPLPFKFNAK